MSTESSAVSDLLRRMHTQRLGTDPADTYLFQPPTSARAPRSRELAPRMFERATPSPPRPVQPARPVAPQRTRTWPLVVMMLVAGLGGIAAAKYLSTTSESEATPPWQFVPASAAIAPAPVDPPPAAPPAAVAPVEAPAAVAPVTAPDPAPTVEPAAAPPPAPATPAAKHHRSHAKPKRVTAKPAKPAPVAAPSAAPAAAPPVATPPAPKRPSHQADDSENPL
jgi:hypothetical protein